MFLIEIDIDAVNMRLEWIGKEKRDSFPVRGPGASEFDLVSNN